MAGKKARQVRADRQADAALRAIPVVDVGPEIGLATLEADAARAQALLDVAARGVPNLALKLADSVSRLWLKRSGHPYLDEIDKVAARLGRPGGHFFNIHYEWGCTTGVCSGRDAAARLVRVLDWPTEGLGREVMAARVQSRHGPWLTLTWPGFTGVLQAVAPGRFAAALNQAPMDSPVGFMPADWAVNRFRVWRTPHLTPAHLLRKAFEEAPDFASAKQLLTETPICAPTIYTLAGLAAGEGVIIERREDEARVLSGADCAANVWQSADWRQGHARGKENAERIAMLRGLAGEIGLALDWLAPPILNDTTRLVMVAEAASGRLLAQGYEADGPATAVLELAAA